jgi:hypothetical protein
MLREGGCLQNSQVNRRSRPTLGCETERPTFVEHGRQFDPFCGAADCQSTPVHKRAAIRGARGTFTFRPATLVWSTDQQREPPEAISLCGAFDSDVVQTALARMGVATRRRERWGASCADRHSPQASPIFDDRHAFSLRPAHNGETVHNGNDVKPRIDAFHCARIPGHIADTIQISHG